MKLAPLLVLVPFAAGCAFGFGGWNRVWVADTAAFELDVGELQSLTCETHNGRIVVTGAETEKIVVRAEIRAGGVDALDAREALDAIELVHRRHEGGVRISWDWRVDHDPRWGAQVSFSIVQPARLPVVAISHNGRVELEGVTGGCKAHTHNGRISLQDCSGGRIEGVTHNGAIRASLASQALDLRSHNGSVQVDVAGNGPIGGEIVTYNGAIRLRFAGEPSTRLVCTTHNGGISVSRAVQAVEKGRRFFVGELGGGESRLRVETHNGSISVR